MKLKYMARCGGCRATILAGTDVDAEKFGERWVFWHEGCREKQERAISLVRLLEEKMLEHGVVMVFAKGWGGERIKTVVDSRREFLREASAHGELSKEDDVLLRWYWLGLLDRSLSD